MTWSVTLAQHLLSKLAVNSTYTVDLYPVLQGDTKCPCEANDELVGRVGDTSYGMIYIIIIFHQLPVQMGFSSLEGTVYAVPRPCRGTAETVIREPEISIRTGY